MSPDMLHCWHLGVCRDLIGSVVRVLAMEHYWPGPNIESRLSYATASLKRWAKSRKLSLTIKKLTKQNLCWGSQYFGPNQNIFGWNMQGSGLRVGNLTLYVLGLGLDT